MRASRSRSPSSRSPASSSRRRNNIISSDISATKSSSKSPSGPSVWTTLFFVLAFIGIAFTRFSLFACVGTGHGDSVNHVMGHKPQQYFSGLVLDAGMSHGHGGHHEGGAGGGGNQYEDPIKTIMNAPSEGAETSPSSSSDDNTGSNTITGNSEENSRSVVTVAPTTNISPSGESQSAKAVPDPRDWKAFSPAKAIPNAGASGLSGPEERALLEKIFRKFARQSLTYEGPYGEMIGFKSRKQLFVQNQTDGNWYFNFDKSVTSVGLDAGAANNPLIFDQAIDTGMLVLAFEANPSWQRECELAEERDAKVHDVVKKCVESSGWDWTRGVEPYDTFCILWRRYWFFAAMSDSVKNITFHVAPNPYCSSAEEFRSEAESKPKEGATGNGNDATVDAKTPPILGELPPPQPAAGTNWQNFDQEGINDKEIKPWLKACWTSTKRPVTVTAITLELVLKYIPPHLPIPYLKIDAEGHDFRILQGAGNQMHRIRYVRWEQQVDPPPDRRQVVDVLPFGEMNATMFEAGFFYTDWMNPAAHPCYTEQGLSKIGVWAMQKECVYCRKELLPCMEARQEGIPRGPWPHELMKLKIAEAKTPGFSGFSSESRSKKEKDESETGEGSRVIKSSESINEEKRSKRVEGERTVSGGDGGEKINRESSPPIETQSSASTETETQTSAETTTSSQSDDDEEDNSPAKILPDPPALKMTGEEERALLERVFRSLKRQSLSFEGNYGTFAGFRNRSQIFIKNETDDQYYFNFARWVKSVAFDVGAANNPLDYDQKWDFGMLVFAFEANPSWRVMMERDMASDVKSMNLLHICPESEYVNSHPGRYHGHCVMYRRYWFYSAMSDEVRNLTFNIAPNPYCSSAETFRSEVGDGTGGTEGGQGGDEATAAPPTPGSEEGTNWGNFDQTAVNDDEIKPWLKACWTSAKTPVTVPALTLELVMKYIPPHIAIPYVKIDAEGSDFRILAGARSQRKRIRYVRWEQQVDPPKDRKQVVEVHRFKDINKTMIHGWNFNYPKNLDHPCYFDRGSSKISIWALQKECVYCREDTMVSAGAQRNWPGMGFAGGALGGLAPKFCPEQHQPNLPRGPSPFAVLKKLLAKTSAGGKAGAEGSGTRKLDEIVGEDL